MNYTVKTEQEIKEYLKTEVTGQEDYIAAIAAAMENYQQKLAYPDMSLPGGPIFVIGASGCGKTYIINKAAEYVGRDYALFDMANVTPPGYKGNNIMEMLKSHYIRCSEDKERVEHSVIILDEVDKLCTSGLKEFSVFPSLLKFIEGSDCMFDMGGGKNVTVNSSKMMFVLTGACYGIEEIISKRMNKNSSSIGFCCSKPESQKKRRLDQVTLADLINYGFPKELIGRMTSVKIVDRLSEEQLAEICNKPDGVVAKYKNLFSIKGICFDATEEGVKAIAAKAYKYNTGARSLDTVFHDCYCSQCMEGLNDSVGLVELVAEKGEPVFRMIEGQRSEVPAPTPTLSRPKVQSLCGIKEREPLRKFSEELVENMIRLGKVHSYQGFIAAKELALSVSMMLALYASDEELTTFWLKTMLKEGKCEEGLMSALDVAIEDAGSQSDGRDLKWKYKRYNDHLKKAKESRSIIIDGLIEAVEKYEADRACEDKVN